MNRILIISPPLAIDSYQSRWKDYVKQYNSKIMALVPKEKLVYGYGKEVLLKCSDSHNENFTLRTVKTTNLANTRYMILNLVGLIKEFSPDVIFCIHEEGIPQLTQTIILKKIFFTDIKLIYFSMREFSRYEYLNKNKTILGLIKRVHDRFSWWLTKKYTDGVVCHTPEIRNQLIKDGYKKKILIQTQYGVDPSQFRRDEHIRKNMRKIFGLHSFTVCYCGRFVKEKGVLDLLASLEQVEGDWQLLLIGDGILRADIERWVSVHNFKDRVRITGKVPHTEVQDLIMACDLLFIGSHRSKKYIDTFPLVVVQAMMCGLPVIGSNTGGIPYQIKDQRFLFEPGDLKQIVNLLNIFIMKQIDVNKLTKKLQTQSNNLSSIRSINAKFHEFLKNIAPQQIKTTI
jgi:L-malate glycosyltransferase